MTLLDAPSLDGRTDRWLALVAAVERLSAAESMDDIIEVVRKTARTVSGADGVTFVLRDGDRCHYVEEDAVGPLWKGRRFPMSACISGWCMERGEMAVIPDIYADPRIPHDAYRPTFVKSLVMVPVRAEKPLAAIGSYWKTCREFGGAELALLDGLGRSTAAAIAAVQARATLRDSEERLRLALAAGGLAAWELDLATEELSASPLFRASFGLEEGARLAWSDVVRAIHPEDVRRHEQTVARARAARGDFSIELRTAREGSGVRWVEMRGRVLCDEGGEPRRIAGVSLDVTDRKQAKERIEALQSELAHAGRLTELGEMSSAFAHELNQPLAAANNYLGAARRLLDGADPALGRALEAIGKADAQFLRASHIIQRIRGFIGKGEVARAPEDVAAMIDEAVEIAQVNPRHRDVDVRLAIDDGLPAVLADKVQIQQVLLNLLRNAFEVLDGRADKVVVVSASAVAGGMVELRVADNGPGLPAEVAARLFEPFVTTKADGLGVGLSICRQIVQGHGGEMGADSPAGEGATFRFTVPAVSAG